MLSNEVWKEVPGFSLYLCSSLGRIFSIRKKKLMQPFIQNSGYLCVDLRNKGENRQRFLVHRIVALTFISNPSDKPNVNHIDGNKLNNSIDNLEWVTNSENILHARKNLLNPYNKPTLGKKLNGKRKAYSKYYGVFKDNTRKCWGASITINKKVYGRKRFKSEEEAAQHYNELVSTYKLKDRPLNII